jgi:arylsulfatase A-like enzyme
MVFNNLSLRRPEMIHGCGHRFPPGFVDSATFEEDRQAILDSYMERIRLIDAAIGRIRNTLIDLGQWDDTLFIVLGDHGEAFFEHGQQRHGYVPFNEVLRVPLIISFPNLLRERGGQVIDGLVWHLDILPTIASLVGLPPPSEGEGGLDLVPVMTDQDEIPADRAVHPVVLHAQHTSNEPMRRVALRRALKYVQGSPQFGDEVGLLFDLERDPDETRNQRQIRSADFEAMVELSDRHSAMLTPGQALLQPALQPGAAEEAGTDGLSPEAEEQLRELGYIE